MVHGRLGKTLGGVMPLALAISAASAQAAPAQEQVEEVVVTGSYIKREAADSPNPLSVIDRATIDQLGAVTVSDVVNNMTFNSGSIGSTNAFSGGDNSTGNTSVNLRNLGLGSTLVLINGKRSVATNNDNSGNNYVDLGGIVPNIALERVEVVKDGSSALYGSDAVAGVVNFITRENFTGFEAQVDYQQDDESGEHHHRRQLSRQAPAADRRSLRSLRSVRPVDVRPTGPLCRARPHHTDAELLRPGRPVHLR